ncbi:MAG: hypothetical protein JST26_11700 [Bacteroidetes bacterium]|nr:hypothetical protein [Bacteroidota bacterium]
MNRLKDAIRFLLFGLVLLTGSYRLTAQTTLVNYDFNSGTSYASLSPALATNITSSASSTEAWQTYTGISSGASAFTTNSTAGNALAMVNSSGTNTRYFQFQLGGSALANYASYKLYLQAQRSNTGSTTITLAYSTDGTTYTNFATTQSPGNGSFAECQFDLSAISALNYQSAIYFRLMASGASGTGTLRIDNFQVQGVACTSPVINISASPSGTICVGSSATLTASGATNYTWSPGGATTASISVSPSSTTNYTVTGANGSCVSTKTTVVTVSTMPVISISNPTPSICAGSSTSLTASGATSYTWSPGGATTVGVSVSPSSTTIYTVTGANGACVATKTTAVNVTALPSITISNSNPNIIVGGSSTLTASGASSYTWSPGAANTTSIVVSPSVTTTYTVTGTGSGCANTQTTTVNVNTGTPVVLVNYDFNSGTSYATLSPVLATNITCNASSTEAWQTYTGISSGANAFATNATAGNAIAMVNSSGTNTRYFQFQLGGSELINYMSYKLYVQAQRSNTGATLITLAYSTDGTTYTNFATTAAPGNGSFAECTFDLSAITAINNPSALYFRLMASGASATGTLRIDNFQVKAKPCILPVVSVPFVPLYLCSGQTTTLTATGASSYIWNPGAVASASIAVTPVSSVLTTTVYTVTGTSALGCSNTQTVGFTVAPNPVLSLTSGISGVCLGNTATLTATGAFSYVWNPGAVTGPSLAISPSVTTVYTVTGSTKIYNCTNTLTTSISVFPLPVANAGPNQYISNPGSAGIGGSPSGSGGTPLATSPYYTFGWQPATGLNSTTIPNPTCSNISTSTNYTLTVTDANGCSATSDMFVVVNAQPYHAVLKHAHDGEAYLIKNAVLMFKFEEEYTKQTSGLNYKIYDDNHNPVSSLPFKPEVLGDNRYELNLSGLGLVSGKYYSIEVFNEKNERWTARFIYN